MYYREFYRWCWDAVRRIKFPPDRNKVYAELYDHMLDRYQSMIDRGISPADAEKKTLEIMGNADELAVQLAAIHRPFWGYALRFVRVIAVALLVVTLASGIRFAYQQISANNGELAEWGRGMDTEVFATVANVTDSSDGYRFRVTNVAVWRKNLTEEINGKPYYDHLYARLKVTNPIPWALEQQAFEAMWAVDSAGAYYETGMRLSTEAENAKYIGIVQSRKNVTGYCYDLYFSNISEGIQWIELHYDRDGRDLLLRIDLTGGAEE